MLDTLNELIFLFFLTLQFFDAAIWHHMLRRCSLKIFLSRRSYHDLRILLTN